MTSYFEIERCKNCPLRNGCYKPGAKSKTYSLTIKSDIHQKAIDHQKTDEFKNKKKQRYKIEAKNAELKQSHGFQTCKFTGLFGMKIQAYLTAIVVNSKRIIRLIQIQAENLTEYRSKTSQLLTIFSVASVELVVFFYSK